MTKIIAVANHKGGVGKTTTAVNVAGGLAQRGHRTLLVDVDAQAHATFWWADDPSDVAHDLQDVVMGVPLGKAVLGTRLEKLDLLPATLTLARLEMQLVSMVRREDRIKRALEPARGVYDFVLLDLAPSLSLVTLAALTAADHIVAPVTATKLGLGGLGAFLQWVEDYREERVITADLLGVLVTMVDARTRISTEVTTALHAAGLPVFHQRIPRRAAAEDQVGRRLVTGDGEANMVLSMAYDNVTTEVLERLGNR